MTEDLLTRARELAVYIIENRATIRQAAKHLGHSKSPVHKGIAERLPAATHALHTPRLLNLLSFKQPFPP